MLLWHIGMTVLIVRYVFRDPRMDLRWVLVGSVLPDVIDKPIGAVVFHDTFGTHRVFGHTLLFPVLALFLVLLATRRGTALRKGLIGVVIGWFVHLILDGVWLSPEAFLWPLFGLSFPPIAGSELLDLVGRMIRSPWIWAGEALGAWYLAWLWRTQVRSHGGLRRFAAEGTVPLTRP